MHIDPRTAPVVARVRGLSDVRAEWAGVRQLEAALVRPSSIRPSSIRPSGAELSLLSLVTSLPLWQLEAAQEKETKELLREISQLQVRIIH